MDKRHQFMMYLLHVKDFYLYHLSPQMICIKEIALEFLDFLQNRVIKAQLPIDNDILYTYQSLRVDLSRSEKFFW